MHLQAAQLVRSGLRQPGKHSTRGIGFDQLLGGPQAFRRCICGQPDDALGGDTHLRQTGCIGALRGGHQEQLAAIGHQLAQTRCQQPPFAQRGLGLQQLGKPLGGPTATGKLGIQQVKAGRDRWQFPLRNIGCPPHGRSGA